MKGNIAPEQLQIVRETVGNWLREKRNSKGLSQSGLARLMGIDQATVNKVEAGRWAISVDMLALFCEHLEHPIDELFKVDSNQELE